MTKDLVEMVVDAMTSAMDGEDCSSHGMARAAIAAVAEWLDHEPLETGHETYDMATARLFKQLEGPK